MRTKYLLKLFFLFILTISVFVLKSEAFAAIPETERTALIALYNSTNGDNWTNKSGWKDGTLYDDGFAMPGSECGWYGVGCNGDNVSSIRLLYNNLNGKIPAEIVNLINLAQLDLQANKLSDSIPVEICNLTNLQELNLSSNQLTGTIPIEIGDLTNLIMLWLHSNQLTGPIPDEIGNLTNLQMLALASNQLAGSIPVEIGNLTNLQVLYLGGNQLTGTIPNEIGNLTNLATFGLDFTQLTGEIPTGIGNLTNLRHLNLMHNQLTGSIPSEIGNLTNLQMLYLEKNQLTGSIPSEIGNMINLYWLELSGNQLTSSIPTEIGNLTNLQMLYLENNQLTGSIPSEIGNLTNLQMLYLENNQLTGSIPSEIGNLTNLQMLYLDNNQLTGPIPSEIGNLLNVQVIYLVGNQLTGSIPSEIGNLTNLQSLMLSENQLTGSIPTEICNIINLWNLDLSNNQLIGEIPEEVRNLINLRYLNLFNNQLTGTIPAEIGNMANMQLLMLSGNQLTGSIPTEIGNMSNLHSLYLNGNRLMGEIPETITNLLLWNKPNINYNALYTSNGDLLTFLNNLDPDWKTTQTLEPQDVSTGAFTETSVSVQWTPISYVSDSGGYEVYYSTVSGGPYTLYGSTADKSADHMTVTGLENNITYYFVVQTKTNPHSNNQNSVTSDYSQEVSATTGLYEDGDGIPNNWEIQYFGDTSRDGTGDYDADGLTDLQEYQNGTNPTMSDSDGDGLPDAWEVQYGLNPNDNSDADIDSDGDGLTNLEEYQAGSNPTTATISKTERAALIALYYSTDGDNWTNNSGWKTAPLAEDGFAASGTEGTWYGVTCVNDHVTVLSLNVNQLSGGIPIELGNLTNLENIDLADNQLTVSIPSEIGNLTNLQELRLGNNQLTGAIPADIGNLTNLVVLDLHGNQLTGSIPKELGNLINLRTLTLPDNQLTGSIPSELGTLINLNGIEFRGNQLTGAIPTELGNLTNLQWLDLSSNHLTGTIPTELGNLTLLTSLNLNYNSLYTANEELRLFLNNLNPGWETTQTLAPKNISIWAVSETSVLVQWTPISYVSDSGGYEVYYSTASGGPYTLFGSTVDKSTDRLMVTGLESDTTYYFVVSTKTDSHSNNQNIIVSDYSQEVAAVTVTDADGDGIPNDWEIQYFGDTSRDGTGDYDNDGWSDLQEYQTGTDPTKASILKTERTALIALYNSTNGDNWTNKSGWKTPPLHTDGFAMPGTECGWYGVGCNPDNNTTVLNIQLNGNNLTGTIPAEIGVLTNLQFISLGNNKFIGSIPREIGNLTNLQGLSLDRNQLTGTIPTEIWDLTNLSQLDLVDNQLIGSIPVEIGNLTNLQFLALARNQLTGIIPAEIGNLSKLQYLFLDGNQFSGIIPAEIGNLTNLQYLYLGQNQLTGSIPVEIGDLANLVVIYLGVNQLTGSIPTELWTLINLTQLDLWDNKLIGTIPDEIGNLTNLQFLALSRNQFTGVIPAEVGNLTNLQYLYLGENQLTGSIPAEVGNLINLQYLYLSQNQLIGAIPVEIGNLSNLQNLILDTNLLTGTIPVEIGNLTNLLNLQLGGGNQLTGTIPSEIGNLINLQNLGLGNNQLTGAIPTEIGNLTNLKYLFFNNNRLTGPIPSQIGNLSSLRSLTLEVNQLTGTIPVEIGNLRNLQLLRLNSNQLNGEIPTTMTNLTFLTSLNLNYNALHTANVDLLRFLNNLASGWEMTQTLVPENVTVGSVGGTSVSVHWTPISYVYDSGGYEVYYSTVSGGPYILFGSTADKSADRLMVTGLESDITYYFVVQTKTLPHSNNQNTVLSDYSHEISANTDFDADGDEIPNDWEIQYFGDTSRDGTGDYDNDGLTDLQEYQNNTNPTMSDSDWDGIPDEWEVEYGLNPKNNDSGNDLDGDGLNNKQEYQNGTDPNDADTDDDGVNDGNEVNSVTDPNNLNDYPPYGTITGMVYNSNGSALTGISIEIKAYQDYQGSGACSEGLIKVIASTDPNNGLYTITGLPEGNYYVKASDTNHNYATEYYNGSSDDPSTFECNGGSSVLIVANETLNQIDFKLGPAGIITGRVSGADTGNGLANIQVYVQTEQCSELNLTQVTTDMNGNYTIYGLPLGESFYLKTNYLPFYGYNYINVWHDGHTYAYLCDGVEPVIVQETQTVDFELQPGSTIQGRVTDQDGNNTNGILSISAYTDQCNGQQVQSSLSFGGYYTISGLPPGESFYVRVSSVYWPPYYVTNYIGKWFDDVSIDSCQGATPVVVPSTGINFKLNLDSDRDGMPNSWENSYGLNPNDNGDAIIDSDGDGLTNLEEYQNGTDPTVANSNPPVANAGDDQTFHMGNVVTLDASGSYDPDEDYPLTYAWDIVEKPEGSLAELNDSTSMNPFFTADKSGNYTIELVVTDSKNLSSDPDEVIVSTSNTTPIADAGPDQAVTTIGTVIQLDGCASWDNDGDSILYDWDLTKPAGSSASLNDPTICNPTFVADVHGEYEIELVVNDPWVFSEPDIVKVSFENISPVADAGNNQSVIQGNRVYLDGSGSNDANLDMLTYSWSIVSRPDNSAAEINDPESANTYFIADVPGEYVVSLIVNDGLVDSIPNNITIIAISNVDAATEDLQDAMTIINSLDVSLFKNKNNKKALTNKINTVLSKMEEGDYQDAIHKLENDILDKMDGCEENGSPENNDWIIDCAAQDQVYSVIMDAINNITTVLITHEDAATVDLEEAKTIINSLDASDFKGKNSKIKLTNKINTVLLKIDEGNYQGAIHKLVNDIIGKMDGCEASGSPDSNDWIIDCVAQDQVYPVIMDAISALQNLN